MKRKTKDAPGMKGFRPRTKKGPLRRKRGDTLVRTIEEEYAVDLGVNPRMRLDTLLKKRGIDSLNDLITGK